jgi:hypothetical protein
VIRAIEEVSSTYGLGFSRLQSFYHPSRKPKTCDGGWFARLRGAYLNECKRALLVAEHNLLIEQAKGPLDDVDEGLLADVQDLLAKVREKEKAR